MLYARQSRLIAFPVPHPQKRCFLTKAHVPSRAEQLLEEHRLKMAIFRAATKKDRLHAEIFLEYSLYIAIVWYNDSNNPSFLTNQYIESEDFS